jgi:hypothetical protein
MGPRSFRGIVTVKISGGALSSILVEALCYKPEDRGLETR